MHVALTDLGSQPPAAEPRPQQGAAKAKGGVSSGPRPVCDPYVVREIGQEEAEASVDRWQELVECTAEPNVFYEPQQLLPALRHLAGPDRAALVVVEGRSLDPKRPEPVWCAVVPVQRRLSYRGRRMPGLATWRHDYAYCGTPLVREDVAEEAVEAYLDWLRTDARGGRTFLLSWLPADGPVLKQFVACLQKRGDASFVARQFARAEFRPEADAEAYLAKHWSRKNRHEARRAHRRLVEEGAFAFEAFDETCDAETWRSDFLRLENSGWKGDQGTSFAADANHTRYLQEVWSAAAASNRLIAHRMTLDGEPLAMNVAFACSEGAYYFKTAFAEAHAKRSPGVVQELLFLETLHAKKLAWVDSCAQPNHPMIDRLWRGRRLMQSLWFSTGSSFGDFAIAGLSALNWTERFVAKSVKGLRRKRKH